MRRWVGRAGVLHADLLGENILMGGSSSAFMLQPSSYEGQVGLNVAAGVTTVTLTWVP